MRVTDTATPPPLSPPRGRAPEPGPGRPRGFAEVMQEAQPAPTPASAGSSSAAPVVAVQVVAPQGAAPEVIDAALTAPTRPTTPAASVAVTGAAIVATTSNAAMPELLDGFEVSFDEEPSATTAVLGEMIDATAVTEPVAASDAGGALAPTLTIDAPATMQGRPAQASGEPTVAIDSVEAPRGDEPATTPTAHTRIVIEHEDERVVVSVALRHGTVDVAIRTGNHDLASAVARSLDELDGALRGHGLALGDLVAGDAPEDRPPSPRPGRRGPARRDEVGPTTPAESGPISDPRLRALA